jgi:hypothetical protein
MYETAINCLVERVHLREIQEKEHVQEGHHFDAQECRRQIQDLQAAIQALQTPPSASETQNPEPETAAGPSGGPGCPTTGRPETRPNARPDTPQSICKGLPARCKGKSRKHHNGGQES